MIGRCRENCLTNPHFAAEESGFLSETRILGVRLIVLLLICAWSVLYPRTAAAQGSITNATPCFAGDSLTKVSSAGVRGIASQPVLNLNGSQISFWSTNDLVPPTNADGNIEVFLENTNTLTKTQVTNSLGSILGGFNLAPSIDASGKHLAFYSDRDLVPGQNSDGNFEIFLATLGSGRRLEH